MQQESIHKNVKWNFPTIANLQSHPVVAAEKLNLEIEETVIRDQEKDAASQIVITPEIPQFAISPKEYLAKTDKAAVEEAESVKENVETVDLTALAVENLVLLREHNVKIVDNTLVHLFTDGVNSITINGVTVIFVENKGK